MFIYYFPYVESAVQNKAQARFNGCAENCLIRLANKSNACNNDMPPNFEKLMPQTGRAR